MADYQTDNHCYTEDSTDLPKPHIWIDDDPGPLRKRTPNNKRKKTESIIVCSHFDPNSNTADRGSSYLPYIDIPPDTAYSANK